MFVRWNRRKRSGMMPGWKPKADAVYAVLVESIRINGKPRQRTIKYLGYIVTDRINSPFPAKEFWASAEKGLSELDLSPEVRDKIIADLKKVVPIPTKKDVEKARKEAEKLMSEFKMMLKFR